MTFIYSTYQSFNKRISIVLAARSTFELIMCSPSTLPSLHGDRTDREKNITSTNRISKAYIENIENATD